MPYGIKLRVWGNNACFTRPEMKVERVSYDVMTPSAARGILEAIYWKPEIVWVIDRIHVLKPIRFENIRRNELASKIPAKNVKSAMKGIDTSLGVYIEADRQQRAALILRDVDYVIEAHFIFATHGDSNNGKHLEQFQRRAEKGKCFHRPYLGCREFPAFFSLVKDASPEPAVENMTRDLGWMLHDIDFPCNREPRFFRAKMVRGIVEIPHFNTREVKG